MEVTIRPFTPEDRPAGHAMRVEAFSSAGTVDYPAAGEIYIPDHRRLAAVDAQGRVLGQAGAWAYGQWFLGRRLPMAGVAAVTVQAEVRRQGLARRLVTELLHRCVEQGDVIATLDASAPDVYRRLGFAFAGVWVTRTLATSVLHGLPAPDDAPDIRPFRWEEDVEAVTTLWRDQAASGHGRLDRSPNAMRRHLEPDEDIRIWVAERDGQVVGMAEVERRPPQPGDRSSFEQVVEGLAAADRDTWLALWRMLGAQAPVCKTTIIHSRPHEPLLDDLSLAAHEQTEHMKAWMSRVLDVAAAVEGRGWANADVTVPLRVVDPLFPGNDRAWVLRVRDGQGSMEERPDDDVTLPALGIGAFSALFTGHATASTLAWQKRLTGATADQVKALDAAFCSPQPYMNDHF